MYQQQYDRPTARKSRYPGGNSYYAPNFACADTTPMTRSEEVEVFKDLEKARAGCSEVVAELPIAIGEIIKYYENNKSKRGGVRQTVNPSLTYYWRRGIQTHTPGGLSSKRVIEISIEESEEDMQKLTEIWKATGGRSNSELRAIMGNLIFKDKVIAQVREALLEKSRSGEKKWRALGLMDDMVGLQRKAVERNARLLTSMAKQYLNTGIEIDTLCSEGANNLMDAVEGYAYQSGFKFSTYACRGITFAFNRLIDKNKTAQARMRTGLERIYYAESSEDTVEENILVEQSIEMERFSGLLIEENGFTQRDIVVLRHRYGIGTEPLTLEKTGERIGLTKERVRQIQKKAEERLACLPAANEIARGYFGLPAYVA